MEDNKICTNVIISGVPSFVQKLWIIVNDPKNEHLICWDKNGHSFHVVDSYNFSHQLLPKYFKHSNISSFIRQLNMYGFKKVVNLEQSCVPSDALHFCHPQFNCKGQADLIQIKRKSTSVGPSGSIFPTLTLDGPESDPDMSTVTNDMNCLRIKADSLECIVAELKYDNSCINDELNELRTNYNNQQQIINKLISVIVTFFGNIDPKLLRTDPRVMPQLLEWMPQLSNNNSGNSPQFDLSRIYNMVSPLISSPTPSKALIVEDLSDIGDCSAYKRNVQTDHKGDGNSRLIVKGDKVAVSPTLLDMPPVDSEWQLPNNTVFDVDMFDNEKRFNRSYSNDELVDHNKVSNDAGLSGMKQLTYISDGLQKRGVSFKSNPSNRPVTWRFNRDTNSFDKVDPS